MSNLPDHLWELCDRHLFNAPPAPGLFNPYTDRSDDLDHPDAPALRRKNLRSYLDAFTSRPRVLLLAEAPGPWGCRFSGVPLVSESQLADPTFPIHGTPTSLAPTPHSEYSANIVWKHLGPYFPSFFIWNTVPFHPYKPDQPLSIRTPTRNEILAYSTLVDGMIALLRPEQILAIGRKAEDVLGQLGRPCRYIRHPSQGGALRFAEGIQEVFSSL